MQISYQEGPGLPSAPPPSPDITVLENAECVCALCSVPPRVPQNVLGREALKTLESPCFFLAPVHPSQRAGGAGADSPPLLVYGGESIVRGVDGMRRRSLPMGQRSCPAALSAPVFVARCAVMLTLGALVTNSGPLPPCSQAQD